MWKINTVEEMGKIKTVNISWLIKKAKEYKSVPSLAIACCTANNNIRDYKKIVHCDETVRIMQRLLRNGRLERVRIKSTETMKIYLYIHLTTNIKLWRKRFYFDTEKKQFQNLWMG